MQAYRRDIREQLRIYPTLWDGGSWKLQWHRWWRHPTTALLIRMPNEYKLMCSASIACQSQKSTQWVTLPSSLPCNSVEIEHSCPTSEHVSNTALALKPCSQHNRTHVLALATIESFAILEVVWQHKIVCICHADHTRIQVIAEVKCSPSN